LRAKKEKLEARAKSGSQYLLKNKRTRSNRGFNFFKYESNVNIGSTLYHMYSYQLTSRIDQLTEQTLLPLKSPDAMSTRAHQG